MKYFFIILLLIINGCTSTIQVSHILNCPTRQQREKALENYLSIEKIYKGTKEGFAKHCHKNNRRNHYHPYCMNWLDYIVILHMEVLERKLEYQRNSECKLIEVNKY